MNSREEIKQTHRAIAEAMLAQDERPESMIQCANPAAVAYEAYREHWNATATNNTFMVGWEYVSEHEKKAWWSVVRSLIKSQRPAITPERLLEIRQTAELYGACYGWAGTSGRLATMIVELLRVIDGGAK